jgi:pterin-4a-carbinolamine dehydratase
MARGTGSQSPDVLERDFEFKDPDILVHGWNKVRLTLSTHATGGLTDADHALARRIDEVTSG